MAEEEEEEEVRSHWFLSLSERYPSILANSGEQFEFLSKRLLEKLFVMLVRGLWARP